MEFLKLFNEHTSKRREYAELCDAEQPDEDKLKEIDDMMRDLEKRMTEAVEKEANKEPDFQLQSALSKANVGEIYDAVIRQSETRGIEAELQKEFKLNSNQIPLEMFAELRSDDEIEKRAITPGVISPMSAMPIIPLIFPMSVSAFLSVPQPTVPAGQAGYPALTTGATASFPAESENVEESTGAFNLTTLTPKRIQASFFYSREDAAAFRGMGDALRANLRQALSDGLDKKVIETLIAGGTAHDATSAVVTLALAEAAFNAGIDGIYASNYADLRPVISPTLFQLIAALRLANTDVTAVDLLSRGSGFRVSANIPAVASKKQKQVIRKGTMLAATTPIWQGITLIPDEITKAATGEIVITAVMLYNAAVLRAAAFLIPEFQTTA
ncbi:MAG: hypothetical protein OXG25_02385 [Gammaproteobacteria bacterium]|nr:hypothetical protein [Gammaproteobacteria bacterium]